MLESGKIMSESEKADSNSSCKTYLRRLNGFRRKGVLDSGGEHSKIKKRDTGDGKESNINHNDNSKGKKLVKPSGIIEGDRICSLKTCVSHDSISVMGRRRTMEDAVVVVPGGVVGELGVYDVFGVFDGHGGAKVANACRDRMHQLVAKEVEKEKGKGLSYWEKVMQVCFKKMDEEVSGGAWMESSEVELLSEKMVGSTAVVVVVGEKELVVANCGDCRAVLCRGGVAVPLSTDHKPDRPDERQRVEAAGGRVVNWNGSRVLGVLSTSRSIGDQYLKPYVSSEPEVTVTERTASDNFVVIASDGLWDVISSKIACEVVKKCFDGQNKSRIFLDEFGGRSGAQAAAMLAELAMARESQDNISVIVVELERSKY